jgi:hypothetical protein
MRRKEQFQLWRLDRRHSRKPGSNQGAALSVAAAIAFSMVIWRFQKARRIAATRNAVLLAAARAQKNADERSRRSRAPFNPQQAEN